MTLLATYDALLRCLGRRLLWLWKQHGVHIRAWETLGEETLPQPTSLSHHSTWHWLQTGKGGRHENIRPDRRYVLTAIAICFYCFISLEPGWSIWIKLAGKLADLPQQNITTPNKSTLIPGGKQRTSLWFCSHTPQEWMDGYSRAVVVMIMVALEAELSLPDKLNHHYTSEWYCKFLPAVFWMIIRILLLEEKLWTVCDQSSKGSLWKYSLYNSPKSTWYSLTFLWCFWAYCFGTDLLSLAWMARDKQLENCGNGDLDSLTEGPLVQYNCNERLHRGGLAEKLSRPVRSCKRNENSTKTW